MLNKPESDAPAGGEACDHMEITLLGYKNETPIYQCENCPLIGNPDVNIWGGSELHPSNGGQSMKQPTAGMANSEALEAVLKEHEEYANITKEEEGAVPVDIAWAEARLQLITEIRDALTAADTPTVQPTCNDASHRDYKMVPTCSDCGSEKSGVLATTHKKPATAAKGGE